MTHPISLEEARAIIVEAALALASQRVPLLEARGRVLRAAAVAKEDLPAFDRSAMDGYALAAEDAAERFRVVAEIQPGGAPPGKIGRGECARIFTGAALPVGATQVLMQEDCARDGEWMIPTRREGKSWIRRRGEDARRGDVLLHAGVRLGASELSLLAQLGVTEPEVSSPPRALHFTTGNELIDPAFTPAVGQIRDSNSTLIAALLAESRAELLAQNRCGDSLAALTAAVEASPAKWDVLLISGGASVGDYDFGARALAQLGFSIRFQKINLRPGKPLVFATRGSQLAFVIPGNPVSHLTTFHLAIRLALERLEGYEAGALSLVRIPLREALESGRDGRETWWPARVEVAGGALVARPLAWQSSGDLCGTARTNALLRLPPESAPFPAGAELECLLLPRALNAGA